MCNIALSVRPPDKTVAPHASGRLLGAYGVALVLLLVAALPALAQPPEPQKEKPTVEPVAKSPTLGQGLPATDPASPERKARLPLVGTYQFSTGYTSLQVRLLRDGKYSLMSSSDLFFLDDSTNERGKSFGLWSVRKDGAIVLTPTDAARKRRYLTAPLTLYPIGWGPRLYLLEENQFAPFQKNATAGYNREPGKFLRSPYLLRDGDNLKTGKGMPLFPVRWRSFLPDVDKPVPQDAAPAPQPQR